MRIAYPCDFTCSRNVICSHYLLVMDYNQEELKMGREVEKEHLRTIRWMLASIRAGTTPEEGELCRRIALDHLDEDPKYYSKLKTLGL